ncbi:unnamed protein product [Psylliodes chrysocephalus]|uniref:Uncharacterized protein n=1 Tax=Psylliodes chrysocephalus TaxID=3402493 RepID=A0A9P0CVD2_9CUCU|nr:unnamed protein product [Psylliodes chrysocephala]
MSISNDDNEFEDGVEYHKKIEYLVKSLKSTGAAPKDKRGLHGKQENSLSIETKSAVREHINSFKGRNGHYSLNRTSKLYLPKDLCVKKTNNMFCELNSTSKLSYESYRTIFNHDFNIGFGYLRTNTCSTCDEFVVKLKGLEAEKRRASNDKDVKKITKKN